MIKIQAGLTTVIL